MPAEHLAKVIAHAIFASGESNNAVELHDLQK